ncbi:hypothetical protein [Serratia odorifera]|jgi:hypothetical protein|uniref:Uncharacterized protein n=1 Tax=Serratia odorifera DSM 4582 TaxID=667129 RepID=D4E5L6_SEROD|nr:hypothetical protein [Serratia odorifera]EFE95032.1 hypothetical protein HMPREF0758_3466 [Serratia odorifera DSM 4582]MBJ2067530.1 hypothetical protein [Serratia odorifera]HEJ9093919.1 hypothetical protein [Serratia odorifera]
MQNKSPQQASVALEAPALSRYTMVKELDLILQVPMISGRRQEIGT